MSYISILPASRPCATHFSQHTWNVWELCFLAVSWMASHRWAAWCKPTAPRGTARLLTAGGRQASHMDLIRVWWTCSIGVPLPTHSRMVLAGYKSVCSMLPVWAGFSQNEYLWCFHISDKPLESHNVIWIQMRLMATAQCPTTKTNSCKSDPVHRGLKLNQCRGLNDPVVTARPVCWWAPYGNRLGSTASGRWPQGYGCWFLERRNNSSSHLLITRSDIYLYITHRRKVRLQLREAVSRSVCVVMAS